MLPKRQSFLARRAVESFGVSLMARTTGLQYGAAIRESPESHWLSGALAMTT